jgi:PAS domain S-box-containing protein
VGCCVRPISASICALGRKTEAAAEHNSRVRFVASRRLCFWWSAEKSSSGQYRIDGSYKWRTDKITQSILDELPILRLNADKAIGLLASIVDSSDDAIVSKTLEGVITSWNQGAERLFGYTAKEAIGQPISMIIPLDRRDEETRILARLRQGELIEHFDTVRVRKDGTKVEISLSISPVRDAAGKIIGASKIARDITGRKRIERELSESEQRFRTLADALDTQVQFRTQELRRRNAEILQQSDQLRDLSGRLMLAQDEERRRIPVNCTTALASIWLH